MVEWGNMKQFLKPTKLKIFITIFFIIFIVYVGNFFNTYFGNDIIDYFFKSLFLIFIKPLEIIVAIFYFFIQSDWTKNKIINILLSVIIFTILISYWYLLSCSIVLFYGLLKKKHKSMASLITIILIIIIISVIAGIIWEDDHYYINKQEKAYQESLKVCKNRALAPSCDVYCIKPCHERSSDDCCNPPFEHFCICN